MNEEERPENAEESAETVSASDDEAEIQSSLVAFCERVKNHDHVFHTFEESMTSTGALSLIALPAVAWFLDWHGFC